MKINESQLRKLIREEMKRKLNESSGHGEIVDQIAGAMAMSLEDALSHIAPKIVKDVIARRPDDAFSPARHEDIEAFAAAISEQLSSENIMRGVVENLAAQVLRNLMRSQ